MYWVVHFLPVNAWSNWSAALKWLPLSCCGNVEQNKQEDRRLGIFSFRDHPPTPGPCHEVQGVSPKVRDSPSKGAASWQTLSLVLGGEASC